MAQKKNCGGARIATICDAGAGYGFSKHLLPLTIGTQGKSYMRCGAFFVGTFPLGGRTNVVPDVCSLVTFPVNVGWKRACVTASKPEASVMSVGSLKAVPMKLIPIGMPSTSAAGTLMMG